MISRVVAVAALLIAGCRMFTCEPSMPEVDAANISGDELVALLAGVVLGELDALARPKAKAPIPWTGLLIFAIVMLSLCKKHGLINRVIDLFVR